MLLVIEILKRCKVTHTRISEGMREQDHECLTVLAEQKIILAIV